MADFKRIMVGLDFTDMDYKVLEYTKMVSQLFKPEVIYFIHAEDDLDLDPEELEALGLDASNPADEELREKLQGTVAEYFQSSPTTEIHAEVVEGGAFKEMLHWSHIKHVDLLIVGKKNTENGKGVLPQKLTRKIDSSVLFVPEDYNVKEIDRVLMPVDFSIYSREAVETMSGLFAKRKNVVIDCLHCYGLPLGWYKTGKSKEEFLAIMLKNAKNKANRFFENIDLAHPCEAHYAFDDNDEPSEEITNYAIQQKTDLIALGARGKSNAASIILGSTTEKLLVADKTIPLLVIKQKGETLSFLEALFHL